MPFDIRAIEGAELDTMLVVDQRGFGGPPPGAGVSRSWAEAELERTRCVFDRGEMVACSRAYSFELTMPGGARVPVAAVSAVAVQPTHRRRGILTEMIGALHEDARERGEAASVLTASEGAIYGRFGYGIATWRQSLAGDPRTTRFTAPLDDGGRMRLVERAEAEKLLPAVYERARARAGMVSRPDFWWPAVFWGLAHGEDKAFFVAVHEDGRGEADGYVAYELSGEWNRGIADKQLLVWDIQSTSRECHAALWRYLFGVDLVGSVAATNVAIDDPLRLLVADPRRIRTEFVNDGLWVLPLDPAALLASRSYAVAGALAIEVHDPGGGRARVELQGNREGAAVVRTTRSPDIVCGAATLGACALGGNRWTAMAAAGLVDEERAGALRDADLMFSATPQPAMLSYF